MRKNRYFYVGTVRDSIWLMELSGKTGAIRCVEQFSGLKRPTYQVLTEDNRYLYSVDESSEASGGVRSFEVGKDLSLKPINGRAAKGAGPCHLSLSRDENYLMAAGYVDGTVYVYPILKDGSIGQMSDLRYHEGRSIHEDRQTRPHAHCILPLKGTDYVYAADLGTDKIHIYKLSEGTLVENDPPYVDIHPGAGPRHLVFDSSGSFLYLINELDNTATVLKVNRETGALSVLQDVSALPEGYTDTSYCSAIRMPVHQGFVYASNRGHDSIAVFSRDSVSGLIKPKGHIPARGKWPRDFNITPEGDYLIVANQNSDSLISYRLDEKTGLAEFTGYSAVVEEPVCVTFVNAR